MCGIIGLFNFEDKETKREQALRMAKLIRHRGPDWSGIYSDDKAVLAHERLAIVDVEHGAQPLRDTRTGSVLAVNGEIYNHKELEKKLQKEHDWQTKSDCEVLLYMYDEHGIDILNDINGIFAFVLYDKEKEKYFIARDHIGIIPLYIGWDDEGTFYVASEMKALLDTCTSIKEFPPGHYMYASTDTKEQPVQWYKPEWQTRLPTKSIDYTELRTALESAVKRQLMSDVPYGVLISGGLDSSIIAAIAAKYREKRVESDDREEAWWPRLHSFSIGLDGSPDTKFAKRVAQYLGTVHHEIKYTIQEGFDAIRDVIHYLETFDVTTIRAATPMYLMARKIKSMGIKMVLSGEGSDEIFGGYLYFHMAPNAKELHEECVRKLGMLSKYDCLRANKSMAAWGVETRVPFLDRAFIDVAMNIDPKDKMCTDGKMEKYILRKAFEGYLPEDVLYRQKEQFSDGVGYGWIDYLKEYAEKTVSDAMFEKASETFPIQTPGTKEEYVYRSIFDELFPHRSAAKTVPTGPTIACSSPTAFRWSKEFEKMGDPSGRAVSTVHEKGIKK
jgi:asparagine synthase (glutamine-hydrolysing)